MPPNSVKPLEDLMESVESILQTYKVLLIDQS